MGYLDGTGLSHLISKIKAAFWSKTDVVQISIDNTPTESSDNLVKSGGVYSALSGKYEKPSGGIPASDLASGVIPTVPTALSQLSDDSTHRLVTDTEKSTWNGKQDAIVFNTAYNESTNKAATMSDVPDAVEANPTVPSGTTPTSLSGMKIGSTYYEISSGSSVTISTDVATDKADNTKATGAKAVYDFVKPQSQSSIPAGGLQPGILYNLSVLTGSVTINLATPSDANVANEYAFTFATGGTLPTITWPAAITGWAGNCVEDGAPVITGGNYYEVSVMDGIALIAEVEA